MATMGKRAAARVPAPGVEWPIAAMPNDPSTRVDGDDDDPLVAMMQAVAREFEADGVTMTLREGAGEPVVLFREGDCIGLAPVGSPLMAWGGSSDWQVLDEEGETGQLTTRILAGGALLTVTTVFRRIGDGTLRRARAAAARLQPLLQPVARMWAQRRRAQVQVRALTAAVEKTGIGIILVNARGEPGFCNAAALALLAEGDGLRRSGALLGGNMLADTLRLQVAIEHVVHGAARDPAPGGDTAHVIALQRARRRPLMAAIVAADAIGDPEAGAVVYVFDPEQDLEALLAPACKLYGLSPVEARLTCLLADGHSLSDAAARMRVRDLTARSYLKQIFLKTDTNRQAELVWLMLKSSVRTAPGCTADFVSPPV